MTNTVRHLIGLLVAATVLVAGCSSTTVGSGLGAATPATGSTGISGGGAPSAVPTGGGGGGGSAGTAAFCAEFKAGMQQIGTGKLDGSAVRRVVAHYDKLYELAPPAIKADVKVLDDYVHAFTGNAPPSDPGSFTDAYTNLVTWTAEHCN
jgi:hypothetical protein